MGRRRQHQAGWRMPVSEWALKAEKRGGGAEATAAGVMNAVQLRKEGRWARGTPARSSPGWFSRLSLLFSGVRRTTHQTPKGRRRERYRGRFRSPVCSSVLHSSQKHGLSSLHCLHPTEDAVGPYVTGRLATEARMDYSLELATAYPSTSLCFKFLLHLI